MPGKLKVRVIAGRSLPVMDRASELTDAFVEVRFGTIVYKTEVIRKSLSPQFNSEWFIFEVEDNVLQDEHLQLRVLDHDTYTAHDAIGKVYIDLDPLLTKDDAPGVISGWFPIFDTMHGVRGELNVIVKVELFTDVNRFRQSSCGVQFFNGMGVPSGYKAQYLYGFVEELVVNDDPEYAWIDHLRTPRSSNEARQTLFMKLSGELRRRIGLKVLDMGGNAVLGYIQCFDLEGESGIVVRGIGTVAYLAKVGGALLSPLVLSTNVHHHSTHYRVSPSRSATPSPKFPHTTHSPAVTRKFNFPPSSPIPDEQRSTPPVIQGESHSRRLSESDVGSPPRPGSIGDGSQSSGQNALTKAVLDHVIKSPKTLDMMEYPFFTMHSFPSGFITHLGGVVTARSVKLLDKIHNPDEPETRDAWWLELRTEIRTHMRTMACQAVVGYTEQTSIWEEAIVLSATGTAALVNLNYDPDSLMAARTATLVTVPFDRPVVDKDKKLTVDVNLANEVHHTANISPALSCAVCHVPYNPASPPFPVTITRCAVCRKHGVCDILFSTIDPPHDLETVGHPCIIQARICRHKKDVKGEAHAKEISDSLPFIEYELHNQLVTKLKVKGMNALFGLTVQITVGDILLTAIATATAIYVASLPPPAIPKVINPLANEEENKDLMELQKTILSTVQHNKERYKISLMPEILYQQNSHNGNDESDEDDLNDLDFECSNKDTFILEVDDTRDDTVFSILQDCCPNANFHMSNTQIIPGSLSLTNNIQMFTQVWRGTFSPSSNKISSELSRLCDKVIRRLLFRIRRLAPCCLCGLEFDLVIPDKDEIQLSMTGVCISFRECSVSEDLTICLKPSSKLADSNVAVQKEVPDDGDIFSMDEIEHTSGSGKASGSHTFPFDNQENTNESALPSAQTGNIELSPLSYVPSAKVERYLGYYNFFFIRETTSLREEGGLGGFMQSFIYEILAIARANVSSMGGNALLSYHISECVLMHNPHKNQAQCLINVSGDTVLSVPECEVIAAPLMTIPEQSVTQDTSL